jgi:hypothetical protein
MHGLIKEKWWRNLLENKILLAIARHASLKED